MTFLPAKSCRCAQSLHDFVRACPHTWHELPLIHCNDVVLPDAIVGLCKRLHRVGFQLCKVMRDDIAGLSVSDISLRSSQREHAKIPFADVWQQKVCMYKTLLITCLILHSF